MKKCIFIGLFLALLSSCSTQKNSSSAVVDSIPKKNDTIRIANDELDYAVIIIEPGFNSWLVSQARPRGYYSESYLESRNKLYVMEWNNRVMQTQQYNTNLYELRIDYDSNIHYGYEVNYLIYNYFIFFQLNYKQQLAGFFPRP